MNRVLALLALTALALTGCAPSEADLAEANIQACDDFNTAANKFNTDRLQGPTNDDVGYEWKARMLDHVDDMQAAADAANGSIQERMQTLLDALPLDDIGQMAPDWEILVGEDIPVREAYGVNITRVADACTEIGHPWRLGSES